MTAKPDNNDLPIDPTHKLNEPVPFDPSQFSGIDDLMGMKLEPKAKPQPVKPAKEGKPVESNDQPVDLSNPPKLEGKKALALAAGSEQVRNAITNTLKHEWPVAYAHYRALKYPTPGTEPTLEQRKAAYEFAFRAFLALTYTKSFAEGQG